MEEKEISALLVKLGNEDETKRLCFFKSILEYFHKSENPKFRELIYEEFNRLSKEIEKANENERQE